MPGLSLSIPNPLGQQEASNRLKYFLGKIKERHGDKVSNLSEEWSDDHHLAFGFKTYGFDIKGNVAVEDTAVKLDATIPFAAMMFKSKIEEAIKGELGKLLA